MSPISPSISARGRERSDGVDHDHVDGPRTGEHVADLERLLTGVGLGDEQLIDIHTDGGGVVRIHGVLGVDVGAHTTVALRFGHDVHGERGLARRFRAVDLGDPAARQASDSECEVERQGAGRHHLDVHVGALAHLHDGAGTELLVDLLERHVECFGAVVLLGHVMFLFRCVHGG